jgi:hypothetical protein
MSTACESGVCGTGLGDFPKPGDPDNNLVLRASPAFGGIDVSWTYPGLNPHAVAHTILYRGVNPEFKNSARLTIVDGAFFFDKSAADHDIQYYYWIQVVSVNGTYGGVIGPATAIARPTLTEMIEKLTGMIDSGMLAQSLRGDIDKITLNKLGIDKALLDLAEVDQALAAAFNQVEASSEQTRALLQQELLARANGDTAVITQVNTLFAQLNQQMAAVQSIQNALVTELKAVAEDITTVSASLNGDTASGEVGLTAMVEKLDDRVTEIGTMYTVKISVDKNGQALIGGFGIYNDGKTVQAGFDVDSFWVGRTGLNKKKPFIIQGDEVFIDQAAINSLVFTKLRSEDGSIMASNGKLQAKFLDLDLAQVRGAMQSSNYTAGREGWKLDKAGTFENNGTGIGGRMSQTSDFIKIWDANNVKRVQLGNLQL